MNSASFPFAVTVSVLAKKLEADYDSGRLTFDLLVHTSGQSKHLDLVSLR